MQTAAVVLVSVFAGAALLLIIGALATLIILHLRAQKAQKELLAHLVEFSDTLTSLLTGQKVDLEQIVRTANKDIGGIVESAKASFSGIRQDIKTAQEKQDKLLANALKAHDQGFRETMGKINPAAMEASSVRLLQATGKIVQVASTLQALLVSHEVPEGAGDLLPEEYAPSDTIYSSVSESARLDQAAERMAVEENAPMFSGAE